MLSTKDFITKINNKYSIDSLSLVVNNTFSLTSLFNKSGPFYDALTVHWFDIGLFYFNKGDNILYTLLILLNH